MTILCFKAIFNSFHFTVYTAIPITCEYVISEHHLLTGVRMPTKKMRVEIFNGADRYTITFEGQVTRDKALRLLDLVELLGGTQDVNDGTQQSASETPKIEKVRIVAEKTFPVGWFSSRDLQESYEKQFNEPIQLSTVSTYLSRLTDRGFFIKKGTSNQLHYRIMTAISNYQLNKR